MSSKADAKRDQTVRSKPLFTPPEDVLVDVLTKTLEKNYKHVSVAFVDTTPDLSRAPWNLASEGIAGSPRLCDVGGVPYLVPGPPAYNERVYDLRHVATQCDLPDGFVLGASACSKHFLGTNAELMPNSAANKNNTHTAQMQNEKEYLCKKYESTEFTLLGNLFVCEGKRGRSLHVKVSHRIGDEGSLITCMRKGLDEAFREQVVGIGGCFLTLGKTVTKVHVMPKFSNTPLNSDADVANWLQFFDANAPLSHLSFMTSRDVADLDVRIEHTHCFSSHGHGGHYRYDVGNKEDVEYEGYFQVAEKIYRVDQPTVTHAVGRD